MDDYEKIKAEINAQFEKAKAEYEADLERKRQEMLRELEEKRKPETVVEMPSPLGTRDTESPARIEMPTGLGGATHSGDAGDRLMEGLATITGTDTSDEEEEETPLTRMPGRLEDRDHTEESDDEEDEEEEEEEVERPITPRGRSRATVEPPRSSHWNKLEDVGQAAKAFLAMV